jgi:hypothetical protein
MVQSASATEWWTSPALWVGILGAVVTVIGWFVIRWREDRQKGLERELKYCERQIEEFYGPIFSLMHQIFAAEEVQGGFIDERADNDEADIRSYFQDNYFLPLHNELIQILKAKLYLVEGANVPQSLEEYLRHACDDRARGKLKIWPKKKLFLWPSDFEKNLTLGLKTVMGKYDDLLYRLETIKIGRRRRRHAENARGTDLGKQESI